MLECMKIKKSSHETVELFYLIRPVVKEMSFEKITFISVDK